ncbi:MAG TPA: TolC family protein [Geoalkalibacter subterraneus]|uniref:TolC family protein n=1 Tax=Geoalkalibacter subterraneus TaxID=483547 RepID=A0A831LR67_9BACT|nr:TolC family protein [Geoalkalibacter subterraneus]
MNFFPQIRTLLFLACCFLLAANEAVSQSEGEALIVSGQPLSLQKCVQIALDDNPAIQAARFGIKATQEAADAAKSSYYPQVDFSAGYHRWDRTIFLPDGLERQDLPDTIGETDEWNGRLSAWYTLYDSGRRRAELLAAEATEQATSENAQNVRQDIVLLVHESYFRLLEAKSSRAAAQDSLQRSEQHLSEAQKRFEAGDVTQADVLRARVDTADARLALVRAENALRIARSNLNAAMGLHPMLPVTIEDRYPDPVSPDRVDLPWAIESALKNRPEIRSADHQSESARKRVDAAAGKYGPRLKVEGHYGRREDQFFPDAEDWSAGVSLNIPLFTGFERTHRVAESKALWRESRAEKDRILQEVRREVVEAFSRLQEAWQTVETTRVMTLDAREGLRLMESRYSVNAATMTDLLDAETALAKAEAKNVEALAGQQIASARFLRSLGRLNAERQ